MTEKEAIEWIHSRLKFGIKPGLKRMKWMLNELGNPQDNINGIHIVGTNGKGSTTSYLQHIFTSSGYHVGTFTSPYIVDFKERISLDGEMITSDDFVTLIKRVKPIVERLSLETELEDATEFEVITLLMFEYFGNVHPVDIAIIEAGMGGLYDSTNVFKALAVVCPSIGLDHQNILGNTLEDIARQKVGVLKQNVPLFFHTDNEEVRTVFIEKARETKSSLFELGKVIKIKNNNSGFSVIFNHQVIDRCCLKLPGEHQKFNAALAVAASLHLQNKYPNLSKETIRKGVNKTIWIGRTEFLSSNLMIDGAHNNESINALTSVLKTMHYKKLHILFSAINTKPVDNMLKLLSKVGDITITSFDYPTALSLSEYPNVYKKVENWREWINQIIFDDEDNFYVITGSLYFISQVRQEILSRNFF